MKTIKLTITAVALVAAVQARGSLYQINFSGHDGTDASGEINVNNNGFVTSGNLTVNGGSAADGSWTLADLPNAGEQLSPMGAFIVDNEVTTGPAGIQIDFWGLLFTDGKSELNLWYNASGNQYGPAGSYSLWANNPGYNQYYSTESTDIPPPPILSGAGTPGVSPLFTSVLPAAVPEPSTMFAGALLLLPFGVSALRIVHKNCRASLLG